MVKKKEATPKAETSDAPQTGTLSPEARENLKEIPAGDVLAELETKAKEKTPSGRKSKAATKAEDQLAMATMLGPTLGAVNELAASKWPEFRHTDEELKQITLAASKVLTKHVDNVTSQYMDEIALAVILGGSLVDKGFKYYARVKTEKPKEKPPKVIRDSGQTIKTESDDFQPGEFIPE